ncbi:hypothetical protein [Curtobacterium sp. MCBD17_028]|uniref:hypothetical protein n=1 Tax=Curtobacterium sp. MCBD17_028 TaxID=2175670 RepID=UPI000DA949A9|nr:hypothetical protein [Curtobacterium sp. MCBD17_028]PZE27147.1 hypothetical protein DEI86_06450 [Curtobacterium sp. MCBD17_028]
MADRFKPLPSQILRAKALEEEERVRGVQWRNTVSVPLARRIYALATRLTSNESALWRAVTDLMEVGSPNEDGEQRDVFSVMHGEAGSEMMRLDVVGALGYAFDELAFAVAEETSGWNALPFDPPSDWYDNRAFKTTVNRMLLEERVEWQFDGRDFVQRGNSVLHSEVIKPVTLLLDSDPRWQSASKGYSDAITELSHGRTSRALTIASSALQDFLRTLGATKDTQSAEKQVAYLQRQGLLEGYDMNLLKPLLSWVNADRSQRGEAHTNETEPDRADVWLMLTVVGALMVRLSGQEPRSIEQAARVRRGEEAALAEGAEPSEQERFAADAAAFTDREQL